MEKKEEITLPLPFQTPHTNTGGQILPAPYQF